MDASSLKIIITCFLSFIFVIMDHVCCCCCFDSISKTFLHDVNLMDENGKHHQHAAAANLSLESNSHATRLIKRMASPFMIKWINLFIFLESMCRMFFLESFDLIRCFQ